MTSFRGLLFHCYMNELQLFNSPEFGEIRAVLGENNEPLFCALDVANALGYKNPAKAVIQHCKGVTVLETLHREGFNPLNLLPNLMCIVL